jgi:YesN/AraC family two-component response regulator
VFCATSEELELLSMNSVELTRLPRVMLCSPDVCRQLALRQPPLGVPIILVSALAEESSVVKGLDSGADDYITKPFRRAEFLARIRGKLQLATVGAAAKQARQVGSAVADVVCMHRLPENDCTLEARVVMYNGRVPTSDACMGCCDGALQASAPAAGGVSGEERVVMCITDDEVNHIVLEGILHSQNYRSAGQACAAQHQQAQHVAHQLPPLCS